jgi:hypothetical protein
MTTRRAASSILGLFFLCCSACTPQLSDAEAERIATEGRVVLRDHPSSGQIDSAKLPPAIAAMRPKVVYVTPDGLYIQSTKWFTSEWGVYVPRAASFSPSVGSDPRYEPVRDGLYRYHIAG